MVQSFHLHILWCEFLVIHISVSEPTVFLKMQYLSVNAHSQQCLFLCQHIFLKTQ